VTGYDVYRNGSLIGTANGTSYNVTGLSASTSYQFTVKARDAAGNVSQSSSALSVTTGSGGGNGSGPCSVSYTKSEWQGGFTANVTITNTGSTLIDGWTMTFGFPGDQRITGAWNADVSQSGTSVTARNVSYNGTIQPGGNTSFGFQGTWSSSDATPTSFAVNGHSCTIV
jgi:Cellobiohydrolase A (1,4-beta-cellobiosidase A)